MTLKRRQFLKATGALIGGAALGAACGGGGGRGDSDASANGLVAPTDALGSGSAAPRKANVLMVMVDEMRFPQHFPVPSMTWQVFAQTYLPNLWSAWSQSVSFQAHHTAATACTPSRASLMTGLYAHQHFQLTTLAPFGNTGGGGLGPQLPTAYPTLGKLAREAGYSSWYFGKWHLSFPSTIADLDAQGATQTHPATLTGAAYLDPYGFDGGCYPDPAGAMPWSGDQADPTIVDGFVSWSETTRPGLSAPWFAVVSLINPHDAQFFWDGPYDNPTRTTQEGGSGTEYVPFDIGALPEVYAAEASNWQARGFAGQASVAGDTARLNDVIDGAISTARGDQAFTVAPVDPPLAVPNAPTTYTIAPFAYWARALDYYVSLLTKVDAQIARVLAIAAQTDAVVVFTSDHGEYAGSHGFIGKGFSGYRESTQIPLFVYDPRGEYTSGPGLRTQLTSSVDVLPMLGTLFHQGSTQWRSDPTYATLYGGRADLYAMLRTPSAPGRSVLLHTYDEPLGPTDVPFHVIASRTAQGVYVSYTSWTDPAAPVPAPVEEQYFTDSEEMTNLAPSTASNAARAQQRALVTNELRKPMTSELEAVRKNMVDAYRTFVNRVAPSNLIGVVAFDQITW